MNIETSAWEKEVLSRIASLKAVPFGRARAAGELGGDKFEILLLTADRAGDREIIDLLGRWRKENEDYFLGKFEVTYERTLSWYHKHLMDKPDRLLFIIRAKSGYVGHVGLFRFDFAARSCEIDNIVRGEKAFPGIMGSAILTMMKWGMENLGLRGYTLKVLGDNERAVRLYEKLGYQETGRIPLLLTEGKDGPEWAEAPAGWSGKPERYYSVMTFKGELK
jgi:RimJ/RimL family protein N-acetyltransferase